MSQTLIPAQPGYFILSRTPGRSSPVLAWAVRDGSLSALPVSAFSKTRHEQGLVSGDALLHYGSGAVVDLTTGEEFGSEEEWRARLDDAPGYEPGQPLTDSRPAADKTASKPTPKPAAGEPVGPYEIAFTGKTYKLLSSWHFVGEEGEFVFQVPPETATPADDRCTKVNREEFASLKKGGIRERDFSVVHGDAEPEQDAAEVDQAPETETDPDEDFI